MEKSQKQQVKDWLLSGKSLTQIEALDNIGNLRLAPIIEKLRNKEGWNIIDLNKTGSNKYSKYILATGSVLEPVKPLSEKPTITTDDYEDIKRRYIASSTEGRIKMLRDAQAKTPQNHREFVEIGKQISILSKGSGT